MSVRRDLPGGGAGATLVTARRSAKFDVTICRAANGNFYYRGRVRGKPVSEATQITLPARRTSNGYVAVNKGYRYEVTRTRLSISRGGKVIGVHRWT